MAQLMFLSIFFMYFTLFSLTDVINGFTIYDEKNFYVMTGVNALTIKTHV